MVLSLTSCVLALFLSIGLLISGTPGVPGLRPKDGAEPTEPSERAGSVPDKESVRKRASEDDIVPIGSLIYKIQNNHTFTRHIQLTLNISSHKIKKNLNIK